MLCEKDVTKHKPNPEVYLKAAAAIGVPIEKCIVFEDSDKGSSAGLAAGAQVIVINNSNLQKPNFMLNTKDFDSLIQHYELV
jgi:beta-phosphoglucomutase